MPRAVFVAAFADARADAGLADDLRELIPETTDDLPLPVTHAIADTSVFIAHETGRALAVDRLPDQLGVSVVTIAELRVGVLAAVDLDARDRRLTTLTHSTGDAAPARRRHGGPVVGPTAGGAPRRRAADAGQRLVDRGDGHGPAGPGGDSGASTDDVPGLEVIKV